MSRRPRRNHSPEFKAIITSDQGVTVTITANIDGSFTATLDVNGASSLTLQAINSYGILSDPVVRGLGNATEENMNAEILSVWDGFCSELAGGKMQNAALFFSS